MTDRIDSDIDALHSEFRQLAKACADVESHPALAQLRDAAALTPNHAGLMLHYAEQLDRLFATIHTHASTLQRLAQHDMQAAGISAIASRTVADLTSHVQPMIATLRRKALELMQHRPAAKLATVH